MKTALRGQLIFWGGFILAAMPVLRLATQVIDFPDGFNLYRVFIGLVFTAIVAFYGTAIMLRRLSSKFLKVFYYSLALIQGGVVLYFIFTSNGRSAINELKWLLFLYDFVYFTAFGFAAHFQRQANAKSYQTQLELNNAQLALLRSQINPHFLYNTLHNIDSLIINEPTKASNAVIMLSDIMRYMMKDSQNQRVRLTDEANYLSNCIALERLRLKKDTFVRFQVDGPVEKFEIAPMLLIPFVENAFKHASTLDSDNSIDIRLSVEGNRLRFSCSNPFTPNVTEKDNTHGIGLNTVRKRLELLHPNAYKLSITNEHAVFRTELELPLHAY